MWLALTRAKHTCNKYFSERHFSKHIQEQRISEQEPDIFFQQSAHMMPGGETCWRLKVKNLNPRTG